MPEFQKIKNKKITNKEKIKATLKITQLKINNHAIKKHIMYMQKAASA